MSSAAAGSSSSASLLQDLPLAPPDPILGVTLAFQKDTDPSRLNLGVGAYRTEEGMPYPLPCVKKVEAQIVANPKLNKEYLPIDGLAEFTALTGQVILGNDSPALADKRVATVQSLSGTGALRIAAEFIAQFFPTKKNTKVFISDPTWGNHPKIFQAAGLQTGTYRYFDNKTKGLDFEGLCADLRAVPEGSVVLLHSCAHNPTGVDPSQEQWEQIGDILQERKLFPLFDTAYQGFASGDLDRDGWAVRRFVERGFELIVTQSYAKNFGLYGERIGALISVWNSADVATRVLSQLKMVIRPMYSNPPLHGARLVAGVLSSPELYEEWREELRIMSGRIIEMRSLLFEELKRIGCPGTWNHVVDQIGMFSFTGLTKAQVDFMREKYHIYMTGDGRISMAGLSRRTVPHLAAAMKDAIESIPA